jgi:hypothetical protein
MHPLSEKWVLWAHLPHDTDWSIDSYISIMTVTYVEEIQALMHTLPDSLLSTCMFFCMKENVKPVWEDPANKNGGCFSYKITQSIGDCWRNVSYSMVGKTLSKEKGIQEAITGISISPKKNFCILKVWLSSCAYQDASKITYLKPNGCIFKKHS